MYCERISLQLSHLSTLCSTLVACNPPGRLAGTPFTHASAGQQAGACLHDSSAGRSCGIQSLPVVQALPVTPQCTYLLQVNKLEHVPVIRNIINLPVINGLLTSFLPSLILRIFLALLPTLLIFMNKVQGMVSTSSIEFGVVSRAVAVPFVGGTFGVTKQ